MDERSAPPFLVQAHRRRAFDWARRREAQSKDWEGMYRDLANSLAPVFGRGRRLGGDDMAGIADAFAARIRAMGSVYLAENAVAGTRTRPKAEEREILALLPLVRICDGDGFTSELLSVRLHLTSRRATLQTERAGLLYNAHSHMRAIERRICPEDNVEGELLRSLLDHAGTLALWRRAHSTGSIPHWLAPALPMRDGLVLGVFQEVTEGHCRRMQVDGTGVRHLPFAGNSLLAVNLGDRVSHARFRALTAIDLDPMAVGKNRLWAIMQEYAERHAPVLMAIGEASLWNDRTAPSPLRTMSRVDVQAAALDLVRIASNREWRKTLTAPPTCHIDQVIGLPPLAERMLEEAPAALAM